MTTSEVVSQRLHNQRLSSSEFQKPVEVVRWLGAVQSQDFNSAKWALGLRMTRVTNAVIEKAFNDGKILRTHLMRPTWHFVAPADIRWMLQLTAPRVNIKCGPNYRKLELDDAVFKRSNKVLTSALKGGKHLTRAALKKVLNNAGVAASDIVRMAHILVRAELDGVVCSGPRIGNQFTYALLEERVAPAKVLTRDEALAKLTRRYFTSHGPATLKDFIWWSGLTALDARKGIALVDRHLKETVVDGKTYWSSRSAQTTKPTQLSAHILPAYDEYTVAYKDRQTYDLGGKRVINTWNLLGPIVIVDGRFAGTWSHTNDEQSPRITLNASRAVTRVEKDAIRRAVERYESFFDSAR